MARLRTIKPEFWTSEQVMECSPLARLLFIGLWNFADDLGRLPVSAKTIKAQIFPSDGFSSENILGMLKELSDNGLLLVYEVSGKAYLQITGWHHQRIDKPQPGRCPGPINGYSSTIPGMVSEDSTTTPRTFATERSGEERNREDKSSEPIGSGADAPVDHRKRLFDEGLPKLARLTGKGPDACRSFVGKCLKAAGDDAVTVLGLIEDAERNQVADPSAWIAARLRATGPPLQGLSPSQTRQHQTRSIIDGLKAYAAGSGPRSGKNPGLLSSDHRQRS